MKETSLLKGKEYYLDNSMCQTGVFVKKELDYFWFERGQGEEYDLSANGLIGFHGKKHNNKFVPVPFPILNIKTH